MGFDTYIRNKQCLTEEKEDKNGSSLSHTRPPTPPDPITDTHPPTTVNSSENTPPVKPIEKKPQGGELEADTVEAYTPNSTQPSAGRKKKKLYTSHPPKLKKSKLKSNKKASNKKVKSNNTDNKHDGIQWFRK